MDAFFIAFKLPNLLRRIFAEGAFSQAFVPILAEYKTQQGEATRTFIAYVSGLLTLVLMLVTLLGMPAAPWVIWATAPGFANTGLISMYKGVYAQGLASLGVIKSLKISITCLLRVNRNRDAPTICCNCAKAVENRWLMITYSHSLRAPFHFWPPPVFGDHLFGVRTALQQALVQCFHRRR